jgi:hypothetical protein
MGDVNGDWSPALMRPEAELNGPSPTNAIRVSVPNVKAVHGSEVKVPLVIEDLNGVGVTSYQFDVGYDPAVLEPAPVAADLSGTLSEGFGVAANSPEPGLLRVIVYGTSPVTADGVFTNLTFKAVGTAGSSTSISISHFRLNDGSSRVETNGGVVVVTDANGSLLSATSSWTGHLLFSCYPQERAFNALGRDSLVTSATREFR